MRASILDLFAFFIILNYVAKGTEPFTSSNESFQGDQYQKAMNSWLYHHILFSYFIILNCAAKGKKIHFQQCIISGRALRPPTVPALTLIPVSIRPNMLVANIPFKFRSRYSLLKTFHFNILLFLLSQRHTFKMKNSWWGRIPPLFNKWDLFLGILSPLSSFQTLITQFWNCRDRKVSLIPGFHRSKSNPHNRDTKLM